MRRSPHVSGVALSQNEQEAPARLAKGLTMAEVARTLEITAHTASSDTKAL